MNHERRFALALLLITLGACSSEDEHTKGEACHPVTLVADACEPAMAKFSLNSTNPYYPLIPGSLTVLEGTDEGVSIRVERRVLSETETVGTVMTRVLEAKEYKNGAIYEVARNYYVEASDGTVCYFGEEVSFYENGQVVNSNGSWRADAAGAKPGIIMPAQPRVGDVYYQELAPGVAQDMGRIAKTDGTLTALGKTYDKVVSIFDSNPLEDCDEEEKLYVPGIGESGDTVKKLTAFTPGTP